MSRFYRQLMFVSLGVAILAVGGVIIYGATAGGGLKINPILGHDLDLNAKYYAQAANNTVHDITTQDISISAWVKWDTDGSWSGMIQSKRVGTEGYTFYLNSTNVVGFYMQEVSGADTYSLLGNTNVRDNKWHYVTAIIDRDTATNCKLFLDGGEDGITNKVGTIANVGSIANTNIFTLGARVDLSSKLDGQIRDVKLYYASGDHWSDAQVLYQAQHPFDYTANAGTMTDYWRLDEGSGTTLYGKVNNLTLSNVLAWTTQPKIKVVNQENTTTTSNNPVGWWKMDEGTGLTTVDSSGNGNTGTLTNGPTWATGKLGKGLSFDGVNDYVDVGNGSTFNIINAITISAWVKTTNNALDYQTILDKRPGALEYNYYLRLDSGYLRFSFYNGDYRTLTDTTTKLSNNTWYYVSATYDKSFIRLYVNGVEVKKVAQTLAMVTNAGNIGIGIATYLISDGQGFTGLIDDVRIYNRALSAGEVQQQYNSTKDGYLGNIKVSTGLVGYWKLDDNNALTSVIDYSGKGNTGTAYSGTATSTSVLSTSTAMVGRAMSFDGSNDWVSVGAGSSLNITNAITISTWIKANAFGSGVSENSIVSKPANSYYFRVADSKLKFSIPNVEAANVSNTTLLTGQWYHTVVVVDFVNNTVNYYLNGVNDGGDSSFTNNPTAGNNAVYVGTFIATGLYFNGLIDEVRIWNYARTAEQIKNDYIRNSKGLK